MVTSTARGWRAAWESGAIETALFAVSRRRCWRGGHECGRGELLKLSPVSLLAHQLK